MNTIEDCTCGARVSAFGIMGAWQCDDRKTCRLREHLAEVRSPNLKPAVKLEDFAEKVTDHLVRSTTEVGLTEDQYRTMWGADGGGGLRYDDGKARYDLIPPEVLEALAHHYRIGAVKYAERNWERGMKWGRVFGSLMRHCWAFWRGETYDKDTGSHHMTAAMWNCAALFTYDARQIGEDDRMKVKGQAEPAPAPSDDQQPGEGTASPQSQTSS